MPRIAIASLDDPRVAPYRQLKANNVLRGGEFFIAEGTKLVDRLLESDYETASVLISEKREPEWGPKVPAEIPLYVIPQELGALLVGFNFHVGVMACGRRKPSPTIDEVLNGRAARGMGNDAQPANSPPSRVTPQTSPPAPHTSNPAPHTSNPIPHTSNLTPHTRNRTIVVCPRCDNPENLGAIIRIARGFGVEAVLLGDGCCDPFSRRVLRVSMGAAFRQPIVECRDLAADLLRLRNEWGFELAATVLDPAAEPLSAASRTPRLALLLGNEHAGLSAEWIALCDRRLTIPMSGDADSLNVAVAAGIFLHHFTRGC